MVEKPSAKLSATENLWAAKVVAFVELLLGENYEKKCWRSFQNFPGCK